MYGRRLSDVLRVKITLEKVWDVWGCLSLLNYCLPVDVCAPWMSFDTADLTLSYSTSRILVQH